MNWTKYGVGFSSENLFYDNGGNYILYEPDNDCQLFYGDYLDNLFGEEEGVHQVGEYDFVKKEYIKPKPKSGFN